MKTVTFASLNSIVEDFLNKKDLDSLLDTLVAKLTKIFDAARATFYFYNEEVGELWSYVANDLEIEAIRVPLGRGIAA